MSVAVASDTALYSDDAWAAYSLVWRTSAATRSDLLRAVLDTLATILPGHSFEPGDEFVAPMAELIDAVQLRSVSPHVPTAAEEEKDARELAERDDIPDAMFPFVLEGMRSCVWAAWETVVRRLPDDASSIDLIVAATSVARQAIDRRVWQAQLVRDAIGRRRRDTARDDYFALLHELVERGLGDPEVLGRAVAAGFEPNRPYRIGRVADLGGDRATTYAGLRAAGPAPREGVLAATIVEDSVLLCVLERDPIVPTGVLVAASPPGTLDEFPTLARWAKRIERAAIRSGRSGVVQLADVGPLVAVHEDVALARSLAQDWLGPLAVDREHAVLRVTLQRYLESFGDVPSVAEELGVHPNTIRHRIRRCAEITGKSLDTHEARLSTWWALVAND